MDLINLILDTNSGVEDAVNTMQGTIQDATQGTIQDTAQGTSQGAIGDTVVNTNSNLGKGANTFIKLEKDFWTKYKLYVSNLNDLEDVVNEKISKIDTFMVDTPTNSYKQVDAVVPISPSDDPNQMEAWYKEKYNNIVILRQDLNSIHRKMENQLKIVEKTQNNPFIDTCVDKQEDCIGKLADIKGYHDWVLSNKHVGTNLWIKKG